jgi:hypothetical protein
MARQKIGDGAAERAPAACRMHWPSTDRAGLDRDSAIR